MTADMHVHSTFSFDGKNEAEEMVKAALEKGIAAIAITDHLDVNEYRTEKYNQYNLIPEAAQAIPALKEKYSGKISLMYGVELGQSVHDTAETISLIADKPFDVVLGSVHAVRGESDFYYIDYKNRDCKALLGRYFGEILETVEWGGIDVIAHLTYPLRYIVGRAGVDYPAESLARHDDIIGAILKRAAEKNIGLEINTGGLRAANYGDFDPCLKYIKRFRELGGETITLGSDAHRIDDLGKGIKEAAEAAKSAGFKYAATYIERKPKYYNL